MCQRCCDGKHIDMSLKMMMTAIMGMVSGNEANYDRAGLSVVVLSVLCFIGFV